MEAEFNAWVARYLGGPGSGNFGHAGRPGEVGGSATLDQPSAAFRREVGTTAAELDREPLPKTLRAAEDRIRQEPNEHGFLVRDGKPFVHYGSDNDHYVRLPQMVDDIAIGSKDDLFYGQVFVHNHPSGGALSPDDAFVAASHNMQEIRAVVKDGSFVLTHGANGWPKPDYLFHVANVESTGVQRRFLGQIKEGKMTVAEADHKHWATVWPEVQKRLQIESKLNGKGTIMFRFEPK